MIHEAYYNPPQPHLEWGGKFPAEIFTQIWSLSKINTSDRSLVLKQADYETRTSKNINPTFDEALFPSVTSFCQPPKLFKSIVNTTSSIHSQEKMISEKSLFIRFTRQVKR